MPTITMSAKLKDQGHISASTRKLRENVKAILENYGEMIKAAKVSDSEQPRAAEVQIAHVEHEIEVRAANIVRAAENLSKLVSDLKEFLILNDFSSVNDSCTQHISELAAAQAQNRAELETLYSQAATVAAGLAGQTVINSTHNQEEQKQHRT